MQIEQSTSLCDIKFKIVFLGDMGVGKTSIIERFVKDQFQPANNPTIGIDFLCRNLTLNSKTYRLQLWDTAGQQKYKSLVPAYLRDAQCVVFVVDITKKQSLPNLNGWIQLYKDQQPPDSITYLLANKIDLKEQRELGSQQICEFAEREGLKYRQVSAKTGEGVMDCFQKILTKLDKSDPQKEKQKDENFELTQRFFEKYDRLKSQNEQRSMSCCYI